MESFSAFDTVKEHIWRDFGSFLDADPFKILHILGFALINCPFQGRGIGKGGTNGEVRRGKNKTRRYGD